MQSANQSTLVKKSVTLDVVKLKRLKKLLKTKNDSETIRVIIEEALNLRSALTANKRWRTAGGSTPTIWR